jgi:hypothetical protein
MKVYIAARYGRRAEMLGLAGLIERRGHTVTSRWILGEHEDKDDSATFEMMSTWAAEDIADIKAADVLLAITEEPGAAVGGRGGRHVELGVALALGLTVLVVGPAEHIFHIAPGVEAFSSTGDALDVLDWMELTDDPGPTRTDTDGPDPFEPREGEE